MSNHYRISQSSCSLELEPPRDKTNKMACAPSEDRSAWASTQSDQSSLSAWRKIGSWAAHWAHSEDSDQTGRMPRLIWVFAGRTCNFVGFVMRRLILLSTRNMKWARGSTVSCAKGDLKEPEGPTVFYVRRVTSRGQRGHCFVCEGWLQGARGGTVLCALGDYKPHLVVIQVGINN